MRAYDQMLRNAAAAILSEAASQWRQQAQMLAQRILQPTREQPFPPADQMQHLKILNKRADRLSQLAGTVRAREVPATDRVHHRTQDGTVLLETLIEIDRALLLLLADVLEESGGAQLDETLERAGQQIRERRQILEQIF